MTMSELKTHEGGCHCRKVRYQVQLALERVMECNCSICSRRAHLLTFVPEAQFKLLSGEDNLTDYQHNKHVIHFLFCKTCGIGSFSRGTDREGKVNYAINVRCLDDVDLSALTITKFDGKSR
jgi:hypothetical protein